MELWKRLPLVLILGLGIAFFGVGCGDDDEEEPPPPPPEGHLTLGTHNLVFGETITEQQFPVSNTGDTTLAWNIDTTTIPYWAEVDPTDGNLAADGQTSITVGVYRVGVGPGTTTAVLMFLSDANDDSLTVSLQRTCEILGDNFNEGNAEGWDATALLPSQGDGYVVLDPNDPDYAGRLMQYETPTTSCVISARLRHTAQTAFYRQYGILLEDAMANNALYYAVYVDNDTNCTLEQRVGGQPFEPLFVYNTGLISIQPEVWNILRLELYQENGTTYARGYAGVEDAPLFEGIELDENLDFAKMGIRSEEYTIHADWFCAKQQ